MALVLECVLVRSSNDAAETDCVAEVAESANLSGLHEQRDFAFYAVLPLLLLIFQAQNSLLKPPDRTS